MKCSTCFCLINLSKITELLPCLIARTILTSIDLIIGLPTIRKHDLVLKSQSMTMTEDPYECKLQPATEGSPLIDLIQIQGPPYLRQKLRARCEEYSDIFDTAVRTESADIPPMLSIKIDETKWKSNKHRLPPRTHSVEKQSQIRQQCDQLLEFGVVRHSTASEWSQVHMVP
jgi:hypothetical protein